MKNAIRAKLKKKRSCLENKELLSAKITKSFLESELYKDADILLLYYSVGDEVSTGEIFRKALADKKRVAFPVCIDADGLMEFYFVKDEADLTEGMFKIKAPKADCERYVECENAVCVLPGLSFDKEGYRIGYGKGYYDRFLSSFGGISAGLCYDDMTEEALPHDPFDKKADYLITDKKIYKF